MIETTYDIEGTLNQIRSGKVGRDAVIKKLYYDQSLRGSVKSLVLRNGGQESDFDIVYNTSLMQFVKTVVKNKDLKISSSLKGYIVGTAKFVWINEFKKSVRNKTEDLDDQYDISDAEPTPERLLIDHSKKGMLEGLLEKLGRNCKEVLMYWANGYNMNEIADMMQYKSDMMARKKKYKCFKELLDFLEHNPHIKQVLR